MVGIVGAAVLVALIRVEHSATMELPAPTGRFAVGRAVYDWVDVTKTDALAPSSSAHREVLVWIWYPAVGQSGALAEYLPDWWRAAYDRSNRAEGLMDLLTRDAAKVRVHSWQDAAISSDEPAYPVAIFRAGLGALSTDYTTLVEDLASHGYVVVGFDAPYRTGAVVFPDGRIVARPPELNPENFDGLELDGLIDRLLALWVDDVKFVVHRLESLNSADPQGRFTGRLDLRKLGMFGHSFGGAQSLQFCHDDTRCKAGIDIDGDPFGSVLREGVHQPFMFLIENMSISPPGSAEVLGKLRALYDRLPDSRLFVTIRGANHFSFSDQILVKTRYVVAPMLFLAGGLYQRRGLAITADYVHTFFDVYLKDQPRAILDNLRRNYPEAQFPLR